MINKTLSGLNDQDSYYDEIDFLEEQGMENVVKHYQNCNNIDLDLLDQCHLYETVLQFEDGINFFSYIYHNSYNYYYYYLAGQLDKLQGNKPRKTLRVRSLNNRKSKRSSQNLSIPPPPPLPQYQILPPIVPPLPLNYMIQKYQQTSDNESSSSGGDLNGFSDCKVREGAGVTPALRRRRERAEQQKYLQIHQAR